MECEDKECTRKHSGSELSGQKSAELLDARHVRLPVQGSHTLVNARRVKMPGTRAAEQHQRRRRNVELVEIWTRVRVQQIPTRRGQKTTSVTDNENLAKRMDEDSFRRGPATSHQLEPVDEENVSKKARVARNVLHIRGEDSMKFDVKEEAWPNADLVIRASCEGRLDRWTARRQSQGWRQTRNPADERSAAVFLGQGDRHSSQQIDSAHKLGSTIEGE